MTAAPLSVERGKRPHMLKIRVGIDPNRPRGPAEPTAVAESSAAHLVITLFMYTIILLCKCVDYDAMCVIEFFISEKIMNTF